MEPCSALALAGNILQFIEIATSLLKNARNISASADGASIQNHFNEDVFGKLLKLNFHLQAPPTTTTQSSPHTQAIIQYAAACQKDCEQLLAITAKLKADCNGSRTLRCWSSFKTAFAEAWKSSDIELLKSRIAERQRGMTVHLCAISSQNTQDIDFRLQSLEEHWGLWNAQKSGELLSTLQDVRRWIKELKSTSQEPELKQMQELCRTLCNLSFGTHTYEKELRILASLDYDERLFRSSKITEAHGTTFNWAFEDQENQDDANRSMLASWLCSNAGLLWVSGKPGSGKSTFMKYIANHPKTRVLLQRWSGTRRPLIAHHFFTIHGTQMQQSLEGLQRSLLFGILSEERSLIPKLMPSYWNNDRTHPTWSLPELESILARIADETDLDARICFFIDGLDEYKGDHTDICQSLIQLSKSPSIKICVSSRPWNAFEDALGEKPDAKFYMHQLTQRDIQKYAESLLCGHRRWQALVYEAGSDAGDSLVAEIVSKSSGVFLWVTLVVRLLREGLTNADGIYDLKRMLSSFPADLNQFFELILNTVDPFYEDQMSRTLLFTLAADAPLEVEMYLFHDLEYHYDGYALDDAEKFWPTSEIRRKELDLVVIRRVNGRCKGFLEHNCGRLEFLHRTAFDFLNTPKMQKFLKSKAKNDFVPELSLLRASIARAKRWLLVNKDFLVGTDPTFSPVNAFAARIQEGLRPASRLVATGRRGADIETSVKNLLESMELSISQMELRAKPSIWVKERRKLVDIVYRNLLMGVEMMDYYSDRYKPPDTLFIKRQSLSEDKSSLSIAQCIPAIIDSGPEINDLPPSWKPQSGAWQQKHAIPSATKRARDEDVAMENSAVASIEGHHSKKTRVDKASC